MCLNWLSLLYFTCFLATTVPTYEDIAALGQGNTKWTVEELQAISVDDLISSLDILGSVKEWSSEQRKVLIDQYIKVCFVHLVIIS